MTQDYTLEALLDGGLSDGLSEDLDIFNSEPSDYDSVQDAQLQLTQEEGALESALLFARMTFEHFDLAAQISREDANANGNKSKGFEAIKLGLKKFWDAFLAFFRKIGSFITGKGWNDPHDLAFCAKAIAEADKKKMIEILRSDKHKKIDVVNLKDDVAKSFITHSNALEELENEITGDVAAIEKLVSGHSTPEDQAQFEKSNSHVGNTEKEYIFSKFGRRPLSDFTDPEVEEILDLYSKLSPQNLSNLVGSKMKTLDGLHKRIIDACEKIERFPTPTSGSVAMRLHNASSLLRKNMNLAMEIARQTIHDLRLFGSIALQAKKV